MRCVLLLVALAAGCSEEAPPSVEGVGREIVAPPPRELNQDSIYDGEGVPRESDEVVAGLTLPLGLEEVETRDERRHVYTSEVTPQALLRYFGPRLTTVEIEREGEVVTYHDAAPREARGGVVKLDVTIEPSSQRGVRSRVVIYEIPPPPPEGVVISEDEIRRHLDGLNERRE